MFWFLPLHKLIASIFELPPDNRFGCFVVLQTTITSPVPNRVQLFIVEVDEGEGVGFFNDRGWNQFDIFLDVELKANDADFNARIVLYRHPIIGILLLLTCLFIFLVRIEHIGHISLNIEALLASFNQVE